MVRLSDIDLPMIFENKLLFSHGFHNNLNITPEEVIKSMDNTNWTDQRNRSLFFSHHDRDAQKWVGRINNPRVVNGELFGDLEIHDADLALKIGPGKAPIGVSAEIRWPMQYPNPVDFSYRGFAMVPNPEVPETMLNFSKAKEGGFNSAVLHTTFNNKNTLFSEKNDEDFAKVTAMEEKRNSLGMSIDEFYAAPRDPPSSSALPIFDETHVRNAIARFNQTKFLSNEEKLRARKKILAAAKKYGIEASSDFSEEKEIIIKEEDKKTVDEPIEEEATTISTDEKSEEVESDLMSAERGLKIKMENNANNVEEEVKETVEEVTTEDAKIVEDTKEADFSEIKATIESLSARINILEEKQAKFSEAEEDVEEESEEEEPVKEESEEEEKDIEKEVKEADMSEEVEEKAEEVEEVKEEVEEAEEVKEDAKADFSELLAEKIDKLADAISKKEAAPMSTAEFGAKTINKEDAVIDRLTKSLSK